MRSLLHLLVIIFPCVCFGQSANLYFRNLTTNNGLSNNKVNCIVQDQRGFIWIGTDDGLNRYDGYRFHIFRNEQDNPASLSGNIITDIHEDNKGLLWIATADGGLSRYDYREPPDRQFHQYRHSALDSNSIPSNIINALYEDKHGFLWLATSGHGIIRFDKKSQTFREPEHKRPRTVLDIEADKNGKLWVGRQGGGLLKIDPDSLRYEEDSRYLDVYAKLPHMTIASIFRDSHNDIWMGSWDKVIYRVRDGSGEEEILRTNQKPYSSEGDDPLSFAEDQSQRIWIGGKNNGLYIFDRQHNNFLQYRHDPAKEGTLADNQINSIFINKKGIVWLGTSKGLSICDPLQQQFRQTFIPPGPSGKARKIYDMLDMGQGTMWIGTSDALLIYNPVTGTREIPVYYKQERMAVTKLFKDSSGAVYIGTNISLFRLDTSTYKAIPLRNMEKDIVMKGIIESRVVSIIKENIDRNPVLMVSPYGHFLAYYDLINQSWISRTDSTRQIISRFNIKDNLIHKFYHSVNGTLWMATAKAGLGKWVRIPQPHFQYYTNIPGDENSIGNNHVYDIIEDKSRNLWVSTYGGGVYHFDVRSEKFTHIKATSNLTEGLQLDAEGNIWMIANGTIHRYEPGTKAFTSFQLPDLEKTGGVTGYLTKDDSGMIYAAGAGYFVAFRPDQVREHMEQPKVFLTDFRIFNESKCQLLFNNSIRLKHDQNFFSFEFAAPDFQSGLPVRYSHRLMGVDKDWVDDGYLNTVNYTNLNEGHYTFQVRSTIKAGIWPKEITSIAVHIEPPFWRTWWFYTITVLFSAGIIYLLYRYRINELLKRQGIRDKIARDLHDNVGSTLSSISVYSQVAKIYRQQGKGEELQSTLEKISSTSGDMISEMNDIVWAINPRNDQMSVLTQRMESFARPLLVAQGIYFEFRKRDELDHLNLEMTKRKNFYLIFKEAITNAVRYSGCKMIQVDISPVQNMIQLTIKDDGKGFDAITPVRDGSLSGNGLLNMKRRAAEMKGILKIETAHGKGTTILLLFPIP